jgi:radical SAM superfamily enzyme YgiQ (UPF0313 family)
MTKKIFFLFPNTANNPTVTTSIPIFSGIAKELGWKQKYFDTTWYQKTQDSTEGKEKTGGFRPGFVKLERHYLPKKRLISDLQKALDKFSPDILAITTMSPDYEFLMTFFPQIKVPAKTITIIGGVHVTFATDEVVKSKLFDIACVGQGENTFREILTRYEQKRSLKNVQGTYFINKNSGKVIKNPRRRMLSSEEVWQTDANYSLFDDSYFTFPFDGKMVKMFKLEVGRGCPFNCSYCGNTALKEDSAGLGNFLYARDIDSIFRTTKEVIEKYKIEMFNFTDECFLARPKAWLNEFAKRWHAEVRRPLFIQSRPETITEENIKLLKSCGAPFVQVGLGVESGSEKILHEVCNRMMKVDIIIKAYDLLNKHGARTNAYFMLGFPHETREDIFETINLCRRINSDINSVAIFQPLPGSKLRKVCLDEGLLDENEKCSTYTGGSILKMPQISAEEISNLFRVFLLYAKLPKKYYPQIEKCEKDYENNKELFEKLVKLRWKIEDKNKKNKPKWITKK